jgi:hypothetical protein
MILSRWNSSVIFLFTGVIFCCAQPYAQMVDLTKSAVVHSDPSSRQHKAVEMLMEEINARTGTLLKKQKAMPDSATPAIVLGRIASMPAGAAEAPGDLKISRKAESYTLWVDTQSRTAPTVYLMGQDDRGVLFAAGRLLRLLHMTEGKLTIDASTRIATAPAYPIRGHQLGYRNTANSYDAWDVPQFEQYIRDLVVFGSNSIELIPSIDPEEREGPHMGKTMWDMTASLSALMDSYGLDVWFWLPVGDGDVSDPVIAEKGLAERRALFQACPRVDNIFVPGGDPGHTPPEILMPWLENLARVLHESHPNAGLWVSNQGFTPEKNDIFFSFLENEKPDWLAGVIFGPWTKLSLAEQRRRTPEKYPIRRYPDITHTVRCQYSVPEWDRAFARTLGREPFNPRPNAMARIHGLLAPMSVGSATYSDGINDDVNKVIWSVLEWEPGADMDGILNEYGRYFIGEEFGATAAEGLYAFEENWKGSLANHTGIEANLKRWQAIEEKASASALKDNWRLQLCLLRAYYDAYVQRRLILETTFEESAYTILKAAKPDDIPQAVAKARAALAQADKQPADLLELRKRLEELGSALFNSIGMQLDVKNYQARSAERGAVLEFLDEPLNNRAWLEAKFDSIEARASQSGDGNQQSSSYAAFSLDQQKKTIDTILKWENPGEGSFYDDLGNAEKQPHLLRQKAWEEDPGAVESPQEEFSKYEDARLSWMDQAQTLFGTPLRMKYTNLHEGAFYRLRVTYAGRFRATMRLLANGTTIIHEPIKQPAPIAPVEYFIPRELTKGGELRLEWQLVDGRGCQVAEVWLIKE